MSASDLSALTDEALSIFIADNIYSTDGAMWEALTVPELAERTLALLTLMLVDGQGTSTIRRAEIDEMKAGYRFGRLTAERQEAFARAMVDYANWQRRHAYWMSAVHRRRAAVKPLVKALHVTRAAAEREEYLATREA